MVCGLDLNLVFIISLELLHHWAASFPAFGDSKSFLEVAPADAASKGGLQLGLSGSREDSVHAASRNVDFPCHRV